MPGFSGKVQTPNHTVFTLHLTTNHDNVILSLFYPVFFQMKIYLPNGRKAVTLTMANRVSIADIANALGLSRNTISKALNGSAGITPETRQRVLDQAVRMNYKMMGSHVARVQPAESSTILLICKDHQLISSFFGPLILQLQHLARARDAIITMQYMSPEEIRDGVIPSQLQSVDGVIGLELLDHDYVRRIVECGKPCVFFDCAIDTDDITLPFDVVLQGERGLYSAINELYQKGYTRFGFVGDPNHCAGFRNRYDYFRLALADHGLLGHEKHSILTRDELMHQLDSYRRALRTLDVPEVFVCANAMIAIQLMNAVRDEHITLPTQAGLIVFETTHDLVTNGKVLVAVNVSRKQIASSLCMLLFDRMQNPEATRRVIKLDSRIEIF